MVDQLNEAIEDSVQDSFSLKKTKVPGNKIPKWIRDMMSKKKALSKRYLTTNSWIKQIEIRKEIKILDQQLKESYEKVRVRRENKFIPLLKEDPSSFYSYTKSFTKSREEIGPLVNADCDSTLD